MRIGYPCINLSLDCKSSKTFRLKNYSEKCLKDIISNNLNCLERILKFNISHNIFFFRITSDLIPFGSHPVMEFNWQKHFSSKFKEIGDYIKKNKIRISMHPGQYTVLNSNKQQVYQNSIKELEYHADILDLMNLQPDAKIVTHVGGVYGNKAESIERFVKRYNELSDNIRRRYVIENDDKSYNIKDCFFINHETGIPIIFDSYHHKCYPTQKSFVEEFDKVKNTWNHADGLPIVHYSSEHPIRGKPSHADTIDIIDFSNFLENTKRFNFDIMVEIKDKEESVIKALTLLMDDKRFTNDS
ncbi:MAG: UV DNA damage repair endonuclease UvsE [Candidatus Hermodarchaeota archaeon]